MEMKTVKIGDICLKTCSGGTPLSKNPDYYNPPVIPWLTTSEVNYSRIYSTQKFISEDGLNNSSAKIIPENSVIIAMYGQGNTAGRVAINKIPLATNQACCNLIINPEIADFQYVYYTLTAMYNDLIVLKSGGAQPNLNAKKIKEFEIPYPDIEVQRTIGKILSAYDDMIDNCKKQIALLEEAAQRLYREWFVDLRFPGHETTPIGENGLPEGWNYTILADIAYIVMGQSPASTYYNNERIGLPFHQGVSSFGNIYVINDIYTSKWTKEADPNSILFSVRAPVGRINLTSERVALGRGVASINHKGELQPFLYHFLKYYFYKDNIMGNGTIFSSINKEQLKGVKILAPSEHIATSFCKLVSIYDRQLSVIDKKLKFLIEARDTLLPRLISGQIEINA